MVYVCWTDLNSLSMVILYSHRIRCVSAGVPSCRISQNSDSVFWYLMRAYVVIGMARRVIQRDNDKCKFSAIISLRT